MPWGYVNYEYKGPRWNHPIALYSRPPFRLDLATRPPTPREIRVFGVHPPDSSSGLGLSQARAILHTLFTFHE